MYNLGSKQIPDPATMSNTCVHCKCKIPPFISQCQVCESPVPRQFDPSMTQHTHRYQHHGIVNKLASDYVCSLFGASPSSLAGPSCINNERNKLPNSIDQITSCNFSSEQHQNQQHGSTPNHMSEGNMTCGKCERTQRPDARFCDWCGHKLFGSDSNNQIYPPPHLPPAAGNQILSNQSHNKSKKMKVKKNKNSSLSGTSKKSKSNLKAKKSSGSGLTQIKAKRKLAKMLRNEGREYVNPVNNKIFAAVQRGIDPCLCRFKCFERVSEQTQQYIFKGFWALKDYDKQTAYLYPNIEILPVKRRVSKKAAEEKKNRVCSPVYYVSLLDGTVVKVCKKAFLSFHGIKKGRVNHILKQKKVGIVLPKIDGRGKHSNRPKKNKGSNEESETTTSNVNTSGVNTSSVDTISPSEVVDISGPTFESTTAAVAKSVISSHNLLHLSTVKPFSLTSM